MLEVSVERVPPVRKGERNRESLLAAMGELLHEVLRGPTRVVALCEGHAVAAGAMLLLVSDHRIGTPGDYQIGFTEPRLGMPLPELPALLAEALSAAAPPPPG
jgi:enoyl-CoA hydratase